ncbi:Asparagine-rich protein (ARP protein), partial [Scheffersomyces stipitis CBS 6054]
MSDVYIVVHIATTCDESTTYVTKDSSELIEFAWSVVDATTLENLDKESVLVRPVNTPITPYCSQLHRITWEHVRNAGSFKDAIVKFDTYIQDNIISKNKEFSLVTFDMSKLRVQLPREARDKAVVLPPYLQHPRVFDLSTEYAKWQITHPEALSYTASSLSNVITALEVEIDSDTEDALKNPLSTSPPAAPVSSDTKTMATVNLFTKILVQLIRKSIPIEDHASVLTKPYDSAKDVSVFLSERSKILYLYNLPNDTTQSELESWFTQFGGRPIAFWTLKNLDTAEAGKTNAASNSPHKSKGIAGFAVFATHEEASESLSMNGRVLNDRAIEVQPSSTRVLDKASDLLTPFPPSKNRARPGDWTCPSCGFSNFQRRTHCFRCSFPASSAVAIQDGVNHHNNNSNHNQGHHNNNNNNHSRLHYNNSVPFRAGDWKCEVCIYHNFAKNLCCLKCGASKPALAI